jgi:addiction module RelE/StbE family toxin
MKIRFHEVFLKHYKKRIVSAGLTKLFQERLEIFKKNPNDPILKNHPLKGKKTNLRAFSITGDIIVVYQKYGDTYFFFDIGSHNQVY